VNFVVSYEADLVRYLILSGHNLRPSGSPSAGMMEASSTNAAHEGHVALDVGIGNETLLAKIYVIDVC
jgi:hypothetical protein